MTSSSKILIVGAGPSGLAAGLFLKNAGFDPHIIEKQSGISSHSKALAVNPTTLTLLEALGLTPRFLTEGRKLEIINIWQGRRLLQQAHFNKIQNKYPFMLVIPQQRSEELLLEAIYESEIDISFNVELTGLIQTDEYTYARTGKTDLGKFDFLIGADGAHSLVREQVGLKYNGFSYDQDWELYDVELDMTIHPNEGHVVLFPEGGMIMIRIEGNLWRIAGSMSGLLDYLPPKTQIGNIIWSSNFRIHHKVAEDLVKKNVVLIGDAAHLHSPVGARGMNLGIQDAWLVSKYLSDGRLASYSADRLPYIRKTVKRINQITTTMAGDSGRSKIIRSNMHLIKPFIPLFIPYARRFAMGLN